MKTYKIQPFADLAQVSIYQIRYWDQIDLIKPSVKRAEGKGSARLYSEKDVIAAKKVGEMRKEGVSLQKIRKLVAWLEQQKPGEHVLAECCLKTDGKTIFISEHNALVDISSKQLALPFVIEEKDDRHR